MATSLSNYDEVLKVFYLPAIQEQLNHETILADKIETNEEDVSGKNFTIECHYGRSSGTGARADGGTLPTASYQKYQTMKVPMRYNYGRVNFSGPTIAATRDEKGAYARVIDSEITGIVRDLKKDINRQYWGCGYGIIARWSSGSTTSATATIYVQKAYRGNAAEPDGAFGSTFGAKYIEENGALSMIDLTTAGACTAVTLDTSMIAAVTVVDRTTSKTQDSFTNTDASGNAAILGDFFVRPSNVTTVAAVASTTLDAAREEMMGLRGIVTNTDIDDIMSDGGTYGTTGFTSTYTDPLQGLPIVSYSWWKATVDTHASGRYQGQRALTLDLMQTMFDKVEEKAGKDHGPDMILTARPVRRQYLDLCQADRRYVNTMELDGGWTAIDYNGVPFTVDNDAIDGEIYFLTLKEMSIFRMSDYDWMEKDGSILSRISGQDAYEATIYRYAELGCRRRNNQGVICDLIYVD